MPIEPPLTDAEQLQGALILTLETARDLAERPLTSVVRRKLERLFAVAPLQLNAFASSRP